MVDTHKYASELGRLKWYSPACTRGRPGVQVQIFGVQMGNGGSFSPNTSAYPFQYHSAIALFLHEGQTGDAWKPSKRQCTFGNRRGDIGQKINFGFFFRFSKFHLARKGQGVCGSFVSLENDAMF